VKLIIPLTPPSTNHYVKHTRNGRHYVTKEAAAFKNAVALFARGELVEGKQFSVSSRIYLGKGERLDADNSQKCLIDSLQEAGVFGHKSDASVKELHVYIERDADNPRTEVEVKAIC
jgi:crossover junction endodeoxyribonuclease RusA